MNRIAGFMISVCLTFGWVCNGFAGPPDATEFADRAILSGWSPFIPPATPAVRSQLNHAVPVWDNGGFITHPGAGLDGADVSMASKAENSAGSNVRQWEENEYFRIADRFEVTQPAGIVQISTFGYEPLAAPPTWSERSLRIWVGSPSEPESEVIFERQFDGVDSEFTGAYRILHLEDLTDVRRPIYEIRWDVTSADAPLWLDTGEYWVDWQVVGGETGWSVYVMEANPEDPDQPTTVLGDAIQLRPIGWAPLEVATPFLVFAVFGELFQDRFEAHGAPNTAVE